MSTMDEATATQLRATRPDRSTWLAANAGSGKTRVLTNRVASLLLGGTKPQNILCLTYTKAAASEMQNRLFKRLGAWAMMPDAELLGELRELGEGFDLSATDLRHARTLFAAAIEAPGGLRIQTIHAFCSSVLRRFPLEAGISPLFREMDDRDAAQVRTDILKTMATGSERRLLEDISRVVSETDLSSFTKEIIRHRGAYCDDIPRSRFLERFGLREDESEETIVETALGDPGLHDLMNAAECMKSGTDAERKKSAEILALGNAQRDGNLFDQLSRLYIGSKGAPLKSGPGNKSTRNANPDVFERADEYGQRLIEANARIAAIRAVDQNWKVRRFADAFLKRYDAAKSAMGFLDFDDLIEKSEALLTDPKVAAWILFKLDGGLDHILVDEAQDTSPSQWRVIRQLAEEFGQEGLDQRKRTIFVVGDKKQSIYSFQGADPREFDRMRTHFDEKLALLQLELQSLTLEYSFRSSPAILQFVDRAFQDARQGGFEGTIHKAYSNHPGRVDIWPAIPKSQEPERPEWFDPAPIVREPSANEKLAQKIAVQIRDIIDHEQIVDRDGTVRPVHEGDFLILVQRRRELFHELNRVFKSCGLEIAGADRLKVLEEIAVKDLRALLSFLALPQDSLSLAAVLRSPLCGLTEAQIYRLAHGRKFPDLWDVLQKTRSDFPEVVGMLEDLRSQADFLPPFEILDRVLIRHGGRIRLLARLGPEAEEGIDEFLNLARDYEAKSAASLTGFLAWLEADDTEVKRQAESAGRKIRVLTTHGAKGLEAPIVILPETQNLRSNTSPTLEADDEGLPIWTGSQGVEAAFQRVLKDQKKSRELEEKLRLLYVAMTRAERWLIICAAGDISNAAAWYQRAIDAADQLGAIKTEVNGQVILRYQTGVWPERTETRQVDRINKTQPVGDWAYLPPSAEPARPKPYVPSKEKSPKALAGEFDDALAADDALSFGSAVHLLLENAGLLRSDPTFAEELLDRYFPALTNRDREEVVRQAVGVLSEPALAHLFGPEGLSEVEISVPANLESHDRIVGIIDRLVIEPGRVLIVDFKSNRLVPEKAEDTPQGILIQLAAYTFSVARLYPGRRIDAAILWTSTRQLMPISQKLVMAAAPELFTP